jgi:hypothetical protein
MIQIKRRYLFVFSLCAALSACQQPAPSQQTAAAQTPDVTPLAEQAPPLTSQAVAVTPHEVIPVAVQDWDHDGLIGAEDRLPWVVNEPDFLFQFRLRDVGFATKTSRRSFTTSTQESTWQRAQSTIPPKVVKRSQSQAGIARGLGEAAMGLGQHNPLKISEGTGRAMVAATELFVEPQPTINVTINENQLKRSLSAKEEVEEVSDAAGYLDIEFVLTNQGVIAGTVQNFALNVYTLSPYGQRLWRTFNVAKDSASFSPLTLKSHEKTSVIIRFEGMNTDEIKGLIQQAAAGGFYFEVATGSVQDDYATKAALSDATDEQTVLVEVYDAGHIERKARISRETSDPHGVVTADDILKRLHSDDPDSVEWSVGDDGLNYLSLFHKKRGLDALSPRQRAHGVWVAEVVKADGEAAPILGPLQPIALGDTLRLSYSPSAAQWRDVRFYEGYPQYYKKFRDLFEVESRFWSQFTSLEEWDVNAAALIKREAAALALMYEAFFREYKDTIIVRALYPNMMSDVEQFKAWFDDSSPQHFTKLTLAVQIESVNLYLEHQDADEDFSPSLTVSLTCGGERHTIPISTKDRSAKPAVYSVEHFVDDVTCQWRPFQQIQIKLTQPKLLGDALWLNITQEGFNSVTIWTPKHMISHPDLNDTSFISFNVKASYLSQTLYSADLAPLLNTLTPRVFRNYETDKADPEALAFDLMAQPGLLASVHSAVLFEGLYADKPSAEDAPSYAVLSIYNAFRATDFARVVRLKPLLEKVPADASLPLSLALTQRLIEVAEVCEATAHGCASPNVERLMHLWKTYDALIKARRRLAVAPDPSLAEDLALATQSLLSDIQALKLSLRRSAMPSALTLLMDEKLDLFAHRLSAPTPPSTSPPSPTLTTPADPIDPSAPVDPSDPAPARP